MSRRPAHFHVSGGNFNGRREATITIEENAKAGLFTVRPKRSRETYTVTLRDVVELLDRAGVPDQAPQAATRRARFRVQTSSFENAPELSILVENRGDTWFLVARQKHARTALAATLRQVGESVIWQLMRQAARVQRSTH